MRVCSAALLAVAALGASRAPGPADVALASCRLLPPATLQLIWRTVPGARGYQVELLSTPRSGTSAGIVATRTSVVTRDTTFTHAGLPAGELRIRVVVAGEAGTGDYLAVTIPAPGPAPVACR